MKQRSTKFNNKRRLAPLEDWPEIRLASLCKSVRYGGNPEHKKKRGDFNLTLPAALVAENPCATVLGYLHVEMLLNFFALA